MKQIMIVFLLCWLCACTHRADAKGSFVQQERDYTVSQAATWFYPEKGALEKAVVVVVHGLNLKPEKMNDWVHLFAGSGASVMRVALKGHRGDPEEMKDISEEHWQKDMHLVANEAFLHAKERKLPVFFLGFSLGALLGLDWQNQAVNGQSFQKMVLLSPAIALPWYAKGVQLTNILGPKFILPGRTPKEYRANEGTSVAAYNALFDLRDNLEKASWSKLDIPTLLIMDKNDELVSFSGIKELVSKKNLHKWLIRPFDNRKNAHALRHLVIDEESIGKDNWKELSQEVLRHFGLSESKSEQK